ncbi:hypothetical protein FZ942_25915 [Azospirillum lipoferum]|uniref:Uncharacterized protein n=1 Tax=Azospirillum lipoferum TaxID=193 RepID=A0A5A9GF23_AZOLI|nr:hypothetical protein FZ942_25915 [Azospirillum lipoferum]
MSPIIVIILSIVCATVNWFIAKERGRSQVLWAIGGIVLSISALITLVVLPKAGSSVHSYTIRIMILIAGFLLIMMFPIGFNISITTKN